MTRYECDCHACTNKYIDGQGNEWCKPMADGVQALQITDETAGTREDPDIIFCEQYSTKPRQREIYPWKGADR